MLLYKLPKFEEVIIKASFMAAEEQINKMKLLCTKAENTTGSELRGVFTHFAQLLSDLGPTSNFTRDFSTRLIHFDHPTGEKDVKSELISIMKNSIDYYS